MGVLLEKEWFMYVFDAALMMLVMLVFNLYQPGEIQALIKEGARDRSEGYDLA